MDGPAVNWKFLRLLREEQNCDNIIDIGSCGLHIIHGALQSGHKSAGWNVNEFLRGIYYLFIDSPAHRADFTFLTECSVFPYKFCQVRWVENAKVCERALFLFEKIKKYVENKKNKVA